MEREQLDVDVLFVGAGPASLSCALHLAKRVRDHNNAVERREKTGPRLEDLTLLVVEKGREIGSHALSGALIDPGAFQELLQGLDVDPPPYNTPVTQDALYFLSEKRSVRSPLTPPPLKNHGNYVASLGVLVQWLAGVCEEHGVEVYPEFPAAELLFEGNQVIGARMGDKGRDREGRARANFEPGIDVNARVTVLGEGPRGTLTGQAVRRLQLDRGRQPQLYAVGTKEIWRAGRDLEPGIVYHTLGFPLGTEEFGGGFIYTMKENLVNLGFVVGLDHESPRMDCHYLLQQFKTHPLVSELLQGGEALSYGAKAIPEGGYYSMPRLYADGLVIVGDSAGFLNSQRLKGIHLAVKSGILAADAIFQALLKEDASAEVLSAYAKDFEQSWAREELWSVRNFRQSFQSGFWKGSLMAAAQFLTAGRGLKDPVPVQAGHTRMKRLENEGAPSQDTPREFDGELTLDKLSAVFLSDTAHDEDQPCHLKVLDQDLCIDRCTVEYGNPCQHFCPAQVYEIVSQDDRKELRVNFSNCVHCKTCEIMDPYQIILWTTPEGGGGPNWKKM